MATSNIPEHLKYSESHEWIKFSNPEAAAVGISDHAQSELTDVVYLELPQVGRVVEKGEAVAVIESVKAANDIYAPVGGEIVEINEDLVEEPESVNSSPYGAGWVFKIRISDEEELGALLDAEGYRKHVG